MTETPLRSITNSGTLIPILIPTYSMKIFYRLNLYDNIRNSPCPIWTAHGGRAPPLVGCPLSPISPIVAHYFPRGVPVTSRYSGKMPISPGTIPMSKQSHPIYRSLCLDHFETPRHVRDHIRDSKQPSVTKIHNSYNRCRHRTLSVRTLRFRELCRHDRDTSSVNNQ